MAESIRVGQIQRKLVSEFGQAPEWVIILGSGLGSTFDRYIFVEKILPYPVLGLPESTVPGHSGQVIVGKLFEKRVAIMAGRVHLYEGRSVQEVVRGVRAMAKWGVKNFIITNAAGAIKDPMTVPRLMVITDHINLTGVSPLTGPNEDMFGPRFPDMSEVYSEKLWRHMCKMVNSQYGISMDQGVYASLPGPQYETPAEVRMLRTLGADAVGMSTVNETIALRHMGVKNIIGISILCNAGAGLSRSHLSHEEVTKAADQKKEELTYAVGAAFNTPLESE